MCLCCEEYITVRRALFLSPLSSRHSPLTITRRFLQQTRFRLTMNLSRPFSSPRVKIYCSYCSSRRMMLGWLSIPNNYLVLFVGQFCRHKTLLRQLLPFEADQWSIGKSQEDREKEKRRECARYLSRRNVKNKYICFTRESKNQQFTSLSRWNTQEKNVIT